MAANVSKEASAAKKGSNWFKNFLKFCKKNPAFTIGFVIMLVIVIIAVFAEQIAPHDPTLNNPKMALLKPFVDPEYPLGATTVLRWTSLTTVAGRNAVRRWLPGERW